LSVDPADKSKEPLMSSVPGAGPLPPGDKDAAVSHGDAATERPGAAKGGTVGHRCGTRGRALVAVDVETAGVHGRRAGIAVCTREYRYATAALPEISCAGNDPAEAEDV
jgi:hypothetical protein